MYKIKASFVELVYIYAQLYEQLFFDFSNFKVAKKFLGPSLEGNSETRLSPLARPKCNMVRKGLGHEIKFKLTKMSSSMSN